MTKKQTPTTTNVPISYKDDHPIYILSTEMITLEIEQDQMIHKHSITKDDFKKDNIQIVIDQLQSKINLVKDQIKKMKDDDMTDAIKKIKQMMDDRYSNEIASIPENNKN
jgi:hypothetical protein